MKTAALPKDDCSLDGRSQGMAEISGRRLIRYRLEKWKTFRKSSGIQAGQKAVLHSLLKLQVLRRSI